MGVALHFGKEADNNATSGKSKKIEASGTLIQGV